MLNRPLAVTCALLAALAASSGCAQIVGIPDRTQAPDDAGADANADADASADADANANADADADANADAIADADANADADADADAPPKPFCDDYPTVILCDDFEGALGAKWDGQNVPTGSTLTLDATNSSGVPSPGHSLDVSVSNDVANLYAGSGSNATTSIDVAFDVYIDEETGDNAFLARLDFNSQYIALFANSGRTAVQEWRNGVGNQDHDSVLISTKKWTRVALHVGFTAGAPSHVTMFYGTKNVLDENLGLSGWISGKPTLTLGVSYLAMPGTRRVHYDNVVFDVK